MSKAVKSRPSKAVRILLVEDSENDARLVVRLLRQGGFDVHHERVESGAAMEAALKRQSWDAVISDFSMPGFTGLDALRILHASGRDLPFILVSGAIGEETAAAAMKAGASDYVMKNNLTRLAPALERELREAAIRAEHRQAQRELVKSEAGLSRAQRMAKLAHVITGPDGKLESWSESLPQLIGMESSQVPGSTREWLDIVHPDDRARYRSKSIEAGVKGLSTYVAYRLRRADGALLHIQQVMEPLEGTADAAGKKRWFNTVQDVTEQIRAAEALRVSEERYRAMFEKAGVGITHSDLEGRFIVVNPKYTEITGYELEEVRSLKFGDLTYPDDIQRGIDLRAQLVAGSIPSYERELRLIHKDGREIWASVTTTLIRGADGKPAHFISVLYDISERKRAESALNESEAKFRDLVEHSLDLVCTHDREGNLLSVNEAGVRLSGYPREALLRMNVVDLLAPAVRHSFPAYLTEIRDRGVSSGLMRIQTAGGELRWWEYHNTLRTEGVAVPIVRGTSHDVTERMRAEKELRESEARFRTLTEMSSDFYWESDAEHRLTMRGSGGKGASMVQVFQEGAQIGKRRWEIPYLSPDEAGWQAHRAVLDAHLPFRDFELSRLGDDGTERQISISGDPLFDDAHKFKGYRGVGTDITERKRAESELRKLALAVRQSGTGIVITDPAGAIEYVNPKFEAMTGYSASEVKGQNPRFLKSGATPPELYRGLWRTITAGKEWEGEIQNRKKTGELYWESQHISPVLDESGRILHFIAVKEDITERKRADNELKESEAKFRDLIEQASDGIFLCNAEGRYALVNSRFTEMLGYRQEELLGLHFSSTYPEGEGMLAAERSASARAAGSGTFERLMRRSDGSLFPAELSVRLLREGTVQGIVRDITERKAQQQKIERLNRVYAVLSGINAAIVRIREREELFREACRIAVDAGQFSFVWIGVVDRDAMCLVPLARHGVERGLLDLMRERLSLRDEPETVQSIMAQAVRAKNAVISNDVRNDPRIIFKAEYEERGLLSVAAIPLLVAGEVKGILALHSREISAFDEEETKLLLELAGDIAFAMDHIEKEERLDYLAYYDSLTGLANRTLFAERLNQFVHSASDAQGKIALALLRVERLASINESFGRRAGDALLKQVAGRLAKSADATEIARIGSDQFAIVLRRVKGRSEAARAVERLSRTCFDEPFPVNEVDLRMAASAGIALFPADAGDAETLLKNAEAALRRSRDSGEHYAFYTAHLTAGTAEMLTLESRLRDALKKDEFVLHYQPKVELETRRIVGVEALIRWQSPALGLVPPAKFIPLMEKTGLILEVGAWALDKAIADHSRWFEQGLHGLRVAVNVSAIQLRKEDFVAGVKRAIGRGPAVPGVDLEITESLVMDEIESNIEKLKAVHDLGVHIAIDDFGTGYSSLGYLARLPVQALKIDRSFIITMLDDPDTLTLVRTIISLAQSLRLKVIAEGVDAEEQAKFLRLLRCDQMQGYLFSKPLPFEQMTALLSAEK